MKSTCSQLSRLIVEKRMLLFLVVVCCLTVVHLVYGRYMKRTGLQVIRIVDDISRTQTRFLMLSADMKSSMSNATNVSGVDVASAPVQNHVDLHVEDSVLGHAGEVITDHNSGLGTAADTGRRQPRATIAVGAGITLRGIRNINESNVASQMLFYSVLLPTFCKTASPDFVYRIYLAYDHQDSMFRDGRLQTVFRRTFDDEIRRLCTRNNESGSGVDVTLHLVECSHAGKPAWAQNDAMLEAYLDHVDYFYRVNDDTRMNTGGWTEKFIATLENYDPPRVGVVGPNHSGGNVGILTYDFVHRTHIEIFGFYYPRIFTAWYADNWVTQVYSPQRSTKLADVHLTHTMALGRRYNLQSISYNAFAAQINTDKQTVSRYVITMKTRKSGN